jgi:hypothetical protein
MFDFYGFVRTLRYLPVLNLLISLYQRSFFPDNLTCMCIYEYESSLAVVCAILRCVQQGLLSYCSFADIIDGTDVGPFDRCDFETCKLLY